MNNNWFIFSITNRSNNEKVAFNLRLNYTIKKKKKMTINFTFGIKMSLKFSKFS